MKHFLIEFPQSDETLSLYYALQDAEMPCTVARHEVDKGMIKVTPTQFPLDKLALSQHIATIKGFIMGWVACYNREALPDDRDLTVNRVPKKNPS
jgi:hypothetical protein